MSRRCRRLHRGLSSDRVSAGRPGAAGRSRRLPAFVLGMASRVTRRVQSSSPSGQVFQVSWLILQRTAVRRGRGRLAPCLPVTWGWLPRVTGRTVPPQIGESAPFILRSVRAALSATIRGFGRENGPPPKRRPGSQIVLMNWKEQAAIVARHTIKPICDRIDAVPPRTP